MADNDTEESSQVVKQDNINEISKTSSPGSERASPTDLYQSLHGPMP